MAERAPGLSTEWARKALMHAFGTGSLRLVAAVLLLVVSAGWFGDSLFELIGWLDGKRPESFRRLGIGLGALPLLVLVFVLLARRAGETLRPHVAADEQPQPVRGLILFLSVVQPGTLTDLAHCHSEDFGLPGFRERFPRIAWRMPVEAIAYHAERLRYIIVIPSAGQGGSLEQIEAFRGLLAKLFPGGAFRCLTLGEEAGHAPRGLDFESEPEQLAEAANAAYEFLRSQGLKPTDILFDITGGTKPATVVGSAVALAEGRRIQYVSTHDYRIRVYDVSYDS